MDDRDAEFMEKLSRLLAPEELAQSPVGTLLRDGNDYLCEVVRMGSGSLGISTGRGIYAVGLAINREMQFYRYVPLVEDPNFKTEYWRADHGMPV